MLADRDGHEVRAAACPACVITVVPRDEVIGPDERRALRVLADAGLIPDTSHMRHTHPLVPTRISIDRVKIGPSVGEAVETVPALH